MSTPSEIPADTDRTPTAGEPEVADTPATLAVRRAAEERGYHAMTLGPQAVGVLGRIGEPSLAALELVVDADQPVGVLAQGTDAGRSAMVLWTGTDLYAITLGAGGRWEHFSAPRGLLALRDSWRGGDRGRYRVPHGPLMRPIPEAAELAVSWGFDEPKTSAPTPAAAPEKKPRATKAAAPKTPRARASATTSRTAAAEPVEKFCPTCFMSLPATGRCDNCS